MLKQYGPLIGGVDLRRALGYRSASAFNRAVRLNALGVNVFSVPGRRGRFALTTEVGGWLENVSKSSKTQQQFQLLDDENG